MKRAECGQAVIEAVGAVPALLAAAVLIIDCGIVVRDRVALTQAAGVAGEAIVRGADGRAAARRALPQSLSRVVDVRHVGSRVELRARTRVPMLPDVVQRSAVEVPA